jgi:hypothetical protein
VSAALPGAHIAAGATPPAQVQRRTCRKEAGERRFANTEIGQTMTGQTSIGGLSVLPGDQRSS